MVEREGPKESKGNSVCYVILVVDVTSVVTLRLQEER
jgi:hypothetical protein